MNLTSALKLLKHEYEAIEPSQLLIEHGWEALRGRIAEEEASWKKPLFLVTTIILLLVLTTGGTVYAAQSAKPGDPLYGVKVASERVALRLAPSPWKDDVVEVILNRRVAEVEEASKHEETRQQTQAE